MQGVCQSSSAKVEVPSILVVAGIPRSNLSYLSFLWSCLNTGTILNFMNIVFIKKNLFHICIQMYHVWKVGMAIFLKIE